MEQVDNEPAVEAAKKKRWEASSDDDRRAATDEYRKALHEAMAKVDPTIAPILDKLGAGQSLPSEPCSEHSLGQGSEIRDCYISGASL